MSKQTRKQARKQEDLMIRRFNQNRRRYGKLAMGTVKEDFDLEMYCFLERAWLAWEISEAEMTKYREVLSPFVSERTQAITDQLGEWRRNEAILVRRARG